jgi:DNA-binding MarR family transcriptional regulator
LTYTDAARDILQALGTGETLSRKEIHARSDREPDHRIDARLSAHGHVLIEKVGRAYTYTLTPDGMKYVREELDVPVEAAAEIPDRLSNDERMALFALLSPSLRVAIADVRHRLGVVISDKIRDSLERRGLAVVVRGRLIRLELTEEGWRVAEDELSRPGKADDHPLLRLLHHHWSQVLGTLRARGLGLVDMFAEAHGRAVETAPKTKPKTVGARVIDAYDELVLTPGGWVGLARLRDHMSDVDKPELDGVLSALFRDGRIKLIAEVNQKTLTDHDRAAALRVLGDDKHLYAAG